MKSSYRLLAALVVLLSLVAAALYGWQVERAHEELRRDTLAGAEQRASLLAQALSGQTDHLVRGLDFALKELRETYVLTPGKFNATVFSTLAAFPAGLLNHAAVVGAQGRTLYSTQPAPASDDARDQPYFKAHRSGEDQLHISPPARLHGDGAWVVLLSRPLLDAQGRFAGVIAVGVAPQYLSRELARIEISRQDIITLFDAEGRYIARNQDVERALGRAVDPTRPFLAPDAAPSGRFQAPASLDAVPRLFAWQRNDTYGLVTVVGLDEVAMLAPVDAARSEERRRALFVGVLMVLGGSVIAGLMLRAGRKDRRLAETEAGYARLFGSMRDAVTRVDMSGRLVEFNAAFLELVGYSAEEARQLTYRDITPPEWHELEARILAEQVLQRGHSDVFEKAYRRKDGRIVPVELRIFLLRDERGEPSGRWALVRDISDRKRAEAALRESEGRYRAIVEHSLQGVVIVDADWRVVYANPQDAHIFGVSSPSAMIGRSFGDFLADDEVARAGAYQRTRIGGGLAPNHYTTRGKRGDGTAILLEIAATTITWEGRPAVLGLHRDITQERQALEQLRASEERFATLFHEAPEAMTLVRASDGRYLDINRAQELLTGYPRHDMLGRTSVELGLWLSGELRDAMYAALQRDGFVSDWPFQMKRRDGTMRETLLNAARVDLAGEACWLFGTRDITERVHAETALRESEERYRAIVEHSAQGLCVVDSDWRILYVNPQEARIFGFTDPAEMIGRDWSEFLAPDELDRVRGYREARVAGAPAPTTYDARGRRRDGATVWLEVTATSITWQGRRAVLALHRDVTEERHNLQRLRASEERFSTLFHAAPECMTLVSASDGTMLDVNRQFESMTGYSRADVLGGRAADLGLWASPELRTRMFAALQAEGRVEDWAFALRRRDGTLLDATLYGARVELGGQACWLLLTRDVSARTRAEAQLRASQARLLQAQQTARLGSWELDRVKNELSWSDETFRIFEIDKARFGASQEAFLAAIHPDDRDAVDRAYSASLASRRPYETVYRLRMADGRLKVVEERCETEFDAEGRPLRSLGTVQDITDRWLVEERLRVALGEKEVLLKEIYHRVKNNLQVVASLMSLQGRHVNDAGVRAVLRDSVSRVKAMALVHEQLYRSSDLSNIDLRDYMGQLAASLQETHGGAGRRVPLTVSVEPVWVDIETAVPLGLIVNELVSNAYKHAFPDGRAGAVALAVASDDDGPLVLSVSDDGIGLPPALDLERSTSLGLQLVRSLVDQLGGTWAWDSPGAAGTRFTLHFRAGGAPEARLMSVH